MNIKYCVMGCVWMTTMYCLVFAVVCNGQSQLLESVLELRKIRDLKNSTTHEIWGNRPIDNIAITPMKISMRGLDFKDPVWLDLLTGVVNAIPKSSYIYRLGESVYINLPILNSPIEIVSSKNFTFKKITQ